MGVNSKMASQKPNTAQAMINLAPRDADFMAEFKNVQRPQGKKIGRVAGSASGGVMQNDKA